MSQSQSRTQGRSRRRTSGRARVWTARRALARCGLVRPAGQLASSRWLFWVLAATTVLVISLAPLATAHGRALTLTVVSTVGILAAVTVIYRSGRSHLWLDVAQVGMLFVLSANCPAEGAMFNLAFPLLWFESFYGGTRAAYLRCVAFTLALFLGIPLGVGEPHPGLGQGLVAFGTQAAALLSVAGARHLLASVIEREHELGRHSVQARAGAELLGLTDPRAIRRVGWDAVTRILAVTPGLHFLNGAAQDGELWLTSTDDVERGSCTRLPLAVLEPLVTRGGEGLPSPRHAPALDDVVGATCTWHVRPLPDRRRSGWMVIGSDRTLAPDVLDTMDALMSQVTLALRNSDAHRKLTHEATVDSLTGLANRAAFEAALLASGTDERGELTVYFIDLDDFKDVNDAYGHLAGDAVLREVASRLQDTCRADDLCVRLGGDEFAVLAHLADAEAALELGHRVARALDLPVSIGRPEPVHLGASVGVAMTGADLDPMLLVRCADVAMYAAKAAGKGTVRMYSPALENGRHVVPGHPPARHADA